MVAVLAAGTVAPEVAGTSEFVVGRSGLGVECSGVLLASFRIFGVATVWGEGVQGALLHR